MNRIEMYARASNFTSKTHTLKDKWLRRGGKTFMIRSRSDGEHELMGYALLSVHGMIIRHGLCMINAIRAGRAFLQ